MKKTNLEELESKIDEIVEKEGKNIIQSGGYAGSVDYIVYDFGEKRFYTMRQASHHSWSWHPDTEGKHDVVYSNYGIEGYDIRDDLISLIDGQGIEAIAEETDSTVIDLYKDEDEDIYIVVDYILENYFSFAETSYIESISYKKEEIKSSIYCKLEELIEQDNKE